MRAVVILLCVAIAGAAAAQPAADVPGLIKLIENQPNDMDRSAWKEKRRDAARHLAQSKDKRATPVLIKLAETETFDIIGEIAIEGLGTLGDPAAIPTLQKIVGDTARDKSQRDLARKSLAKLGGSTDVKAPPPPPGGEGTGLETSAGSNKQPPPPPPPPNGGNKVAPEGGAGSGSETSHTSSGREPSGTGLIGGGHGGGEVPVLPEVSDDTLAAYERLTFAGGTASFNYDTLRKELDFAADVSGLYQQRVERERNAFGFDLGAHVVTGMINPDGAAQSRGAEVVVNGDGEARLYSGSVYGVGKAVAGYQLDYISAVDNMGNAIRKSTTNTADLALAIGGGYGRVLDVGAAIRVRRIARTLDAARALGKPIDAATSKKLQLTWWALRGERSAYRALIATVAILREAGILLGEPDAGLTYEILNVLHDTNLYQRPSGFDVQLAFSEGYVQRPSSIMSQSYENGRIEQLLALLGYGMQLDDDLLEVQAQGYARYQLFAPDGSPSPWGVGATLRTRRFTYGEHGDPFGIIDVTGTAEISTDDLVMAMPPSDRSLRVSGELGFTYVINQASGLRVAAQVAEDGGNVFLGAVLQANYGLLDGTFAR